MIIKYFRAISATFSFLPGLTGRALVVCAFALSGCVESMDSITTEEITATDIGAGSGGPAAGDVNESDGDDISVTGELTILYMDDFDNNLAELQYFIKDKQSKKQYKLNFKDTPPGHLRTGSEFKVRGKAKGKEIFLAADGAEPTGNTTVTAAASVSGEQRTVVMVANFQDSQLTCSVDEIRDLMLTDSANQSIDDYYREVSQGQVWLSGEVHGAYTTDSPADCSAPFSAYTDPIDDAAEADGVDLSLFDRKIYVMPYTGCGYAGIGSVGNTPSQALIFTCDKPDVYAHELGHNFGMYHASTPNSEYGDGTGIMGAGNVGLRHPNSAHQDEMGWLSPAMNTLITESGTYDVAPQSLDEAQSLAPQILRLAKPDSDEFYFIAYRRPVGFDSNLQWWHHDIVTVHRYQEAGSPPTNTYLVGELAVGESFTDAANDITVNHISQTPDYATVQVAFDGSSPAPTCNRAAPLVSLSPASQSADAGTTLQYTVTVANQDSAACAMSSFMLTSNLPDSWSGSVTPASVDLAPGATSTATMSVTSSTAATAATFDVGVTATDNTVGPHSATGNASYTVVNACAPAIPGMSVSPASQSADPGTALIYTVSLVNNDSAACGASMFDLSAGSLPAGWSSSLASQSLDLAPGATGTIDLTVTSVASAVPGNYSVQVTSADSQEALHATSTNTTYVVNDTVPVSDAQPPTIPTGLAANANAQRVNLSWSASSDNVGVEGYRVYRGSVLIATTNDTAYSDRAGVSGVTYAYTVTAFDAANNVSAASTAVMASKGKRHGGGGGGGGKGKRPK